MDVDGDGRVDIVFKDNKKRGLYYLRNTGEIDGRKIVFERKDFKGIPLADVTSPLTEKNIKEYAETYYKQTPFRAWRAPYSGTIHIAGKIQGAHDFAPLSISKEADAEASNVYADIYIGDSEVGKKGSVFRHPVTKEATNVSDTSDIT